MPRKSSLLAALLLLLLTAAPRCVSAVPELQQVHVIARHGARTPLPKDGDSQQELRRSDDSSTLTPLGKQQLYDLGVWLRQVYNANDFLGTYDPQHVRLESSGLDRTLTSANALAVGLFPYETLSEESSNYLLSTTTTVPERVSIPVYSFQDESNDVYFRTYHGMCPKYRQNLQTLYESPQWKSIEANHQALLQKIGSIFPDLNNNSWGGSGSNTEDAVLDDDRSLVLKHLWTYYDKIHVARTECIPDATAPSCLDLGPDIYQLVDKLTNIEFDQVEFLMGTTERMKYGPGTAGSLLGSPLLWRILERIETASNVSNAPRFFLYSAHAPTILGLMSALQETNPESHPDYGSALILEVYRDSITTVQSIRWVYKAASDTMATYLSVREAKCDMEFPGNAAPPATSGGDIIQHCNLSEFLDWAEANTHRFLSEWCNECQNTQADVCLRDALDNNPLQTLVNELKAALRNDSEADKDAAIIAGTFFGGFGLGLLLMGGVGYCCRRRRRGGMDKNDNKPDATSAVTEIEAPPPVAINGEMN